MQNNIITIFYNNLNKKSFWFNSVADSDEYISVEILK